MESNKLCDLYIEDKAKRLDELTQKLRQYLSSCDVERIRMTIRNYAHLKMYQDHRKDNEFREAINNLYKIFFNFIDLNKNAFSTNYIGNIFELAMANLVSKMSKLKEREKREGLPDLEFIYNDTDYILECITKCPTYMDEYAQLLPNFDNYFKLAKFFYEKNEQLKKRESLDWNYEWHYVIKNIWWHCDSKEQQGIKPLIDTLLGNSSYRLDQEIVTQVIPSLERWIFINWHTCIDFTEFISEEHLENLKSISIPPKNEFGTQLPSADTKIVIEFQSRTIKRIAQAIVEKLQKKYCEDNNRIVLAVSIAEFPQLIAPSMLFDSALLKNYLCSSIQLALQTTIEKYREDNKNEEYIENKKNLIINNIKKLYAVLIDTSWYNWLPNIAKERYGANFKNQHENCYGVIYNTNFSIENSCYDRIKIFNGLINQNYVLELPLEI